MEDRYLKIIQNSNIDQWYL